MNILKYDINEDVFAFSTFRHGGYSNGTYSSFNVNPYCGDNPTNVLRNRNLLIDYLGISSEKLIFPHQIHKCKIQQIGQDYLKSSPTQKNNMLEGVDALITSLPDYCICVSTADCIPILIYDVTNKVIACIHAGWRGTVARICSLVLTKMSNDYGTIPHDCKAIIGPGISLKNFEVGEEVHDAFSAECFDMKQISERKDKWHIDLSECNRLQLIDSGINDDKIFVSGICTYDESDDFFSARKLGLNSGRILTGIMIRHNY